MIIADRVGFPVGCPGVHHHDEIAIQKAAVTLGYIEGVIPGLVVQVVVSSSQPVTPSMVSLSPSHWRHSSTFGNEVSLSGMLPSSATGKVAAQASLPVAPEHSTMVEPEILMAGERQIPFR